MDRKSKILFGILSIFIVLSVGATFYKTVILQDFIVYAEIDCDPSSESCFVWECDPEVDGAETCTGNPEEDTWYYKIAYKNAKNITQCEEEDEACNPFQCMNGEEGCREVTCTTEALTEYELSGACTNPIDFEEMEEVKVSEENTETESEEATLLDEISEVEGVVE